MACFSAAESLGGCAVERRSLNKAEECTRSRCVYLLNTSGPASCAILIKPVYLQRSDTVTNQRNATRTGVVRFSAQKDSIMCRGAAST
jgi:hypothetical protein